MALPKFYQETFKAAALSAVISVMPFAASAASDSCGNCYAGRTYTTNHSDALLQSRDYDRANDAIGIIISFGPDAPSPESIGEKFVSEIKKRGEDSRYFIVQRNERGMSISFDFPYIGTEPMSVPDAAKSLSEIVRKKQKTDTYVPTAPSVE